MCNYSRVNILELYRDNVQESGNYGLLRHNLGGCGLEGFMLASFRLCACRLEGGG